VSQYPPQFPYGQPTQDHPSATTILVLGILSLVVCGVLGPFAWSMGNKALREIDASQGTGVVLGGRSSVNAGRICGMIATALLVLAVVAVLGVFVLGAAISTSP
jgi:uncharacterized membrane protein YjgN (DUF898 family)